MEQGNCIDCASTFDRASPVDAQMDVVGLRRVRCLVCVQRLRRAREYPDLLPVSVRSTAPTGSTELGVWRWDDRAWVWGVVSDAGPCYLWGPLGLPEDDPDLRRDGRWWFRHPTPSDVVGLWVAATDLRPFFRRARVHVEQIDARRRAGRLSLLG